MAQVMTRRKRRSAHIEAERARRSAYAGLGRPRNARPPGERWRRRVTWACVLGLTAVLAGAAAAPVLFKSKASTGTTTGTPSVGAPVLTSRTLLRLPAASAVAMSGNTAWATDDRRNLLVRFDPARGRVEGSAHLSGPPTAMVIDGSGLWVTDSVDNEVLEFDAQSLHVVRTVPVPNGPSSLVVLGDTVWVGSYDANNLTPVDARTGVVGTPITVLAGVVRVAAGFGALWVTGAVDGLTRIVPPTDSASAPVQRALTVGQGPIGVATGAGSVWVADSRGADVSRVDPVTLRVEHLRGMGPDPISVAVAGGRVYVGSGTARTVRLVSPAPGSGVLRIGTTPRALLPVGRSVWVAGANRGLVLRVSPG